MFYKKSTRDIHWTNVYFCFLFSSVSVKSSANSDNVPLTEIQLNTFEKKFPVSPVSHHDESSKNYVNYLKVAEYDAIPK